MKWTILDNFSKNKLINSLIERIEKLEALSQANYREHEELSEEIRNIRKYLER